MLAADEVSKLDYANRWMRDGLEVVSNKAGFFLCVHVDVTGLQKVINSYRKLGKRVTYTHIAVKICADLLAQNPEHHKFIVNNRVLHPTAVDIGLSVGADQQQAPMLIIKAADKKSLMAISEEVERRAPEVREQFAKTVSHWKKWATNSELLVKEIAQAQYLILSYNQGTRNLSVFKRTRDLKCVKLNSTLVTNPKIKTINQITLSPDQKKILVRLSVPNKDRVSTYENGSHQIFYIPLDGQPALLVNTPVFETAKSYRATFLKDSRSVLYYGDQIRVGDMNVFLWKAP